MLQRFNGKGEIRSRGSIFVCGMSCLEDDEDVSNKIWSGRERREIISKKGTRGVSFGLPRDNNFPIIILIKLPGMRHRNVAV